MSKREFIQRYKEDYAFRRDMRLKGIRVIQDNVIFFNPDGSVSRIAGNYVK